MTDETFKEVYDFEDYLVSNLGRVYSSITKRFLKPIRHGGFNGPVYYRVRLTKNGKHYNKSISRLVAEAFIPNPDNKPEVDHIDRDTSNNCVGNLRWATRIENRHNRRDYDDRRRK